MAAPGRGSAPAAYPKAWRLFFIEAWADRDPSVRWPFILALILTLIGLAGGVTA